MDGEIASTHRELDLPGLPASLEEIVAVDYNKCVVHVQKRDSGNTLLLTWIDRCRQHGINFRVQHTDIDNIVALKEVLRSRIKHPETVSQADILQNRAAAIQLLMAGAEFRASDIHIILRGRFTEVQFRVNGKLGVYDRFTQEEGEAIILAFYQGVAVVREANFTPLEVQNANISGAVLGGTTLSSVRIVRGPSYPVEEGGAFMILRLQYKRTIASEKVDPIKARAVVSSISSVRNSVAAQPRRLERPRVPPGHWPLKAMGFTERQIAIFEEWTDRSSGMVVVTGPTGSGKTTTLYEVLLQRARIHPGKRIITIEDPIEYPMSFALQMVISANLNSDRDIRSEYVTHALRMDPDTIYPGEFRTADGWVAGLTAAMTGHWVPCTTHAYDPFGVPDRIEILDPHRLPKKMFCDSNTIIGMESQRLVPIICASCSRPWSQSVEQQVSRRMVDNLKSYGNLADVRIKGDGCELCHGTGDKERRVVAEVVRTDDDLWDDFLNHNKAVARRNFRAREDTDNSILATTMELVLRGEVCPLDLGQEINGLVPKEMVNLI